MGGSLNWPLPLRPGSEPGSPLPPAMRASVGEGPKKNIKRLRTSLANGSTSSFQNDFVSGGSPEGVQCGPREGATSDPKAGLCALLDAVVAAEEAQPGAPSPAAAKSPRGIPPNSFAEPARPVNRFGSVSNSSMPLKKRRYQIVDIHRSPSPPPRSPSPPQSPEPSACPVDVTPLAPEGLSKPALQEAVEVAAERAAVNEPAGDPGQGPQPADTHEVDLLADGEVDHEENNRQAQDYDEADGGTVVDEDTAFVGGEEGREPSPRGLGLGLFPIDVPKGRRRARRRPKRELCHDPAAAVGGSEGAEDQVRATSGGDACMGPEEEEGRSNWGSGRDAEDWKRSPSSSLASMECSKPELDDQGDGVHGEGGEPAAKKPKSIRPKGANSRNLKEGKVGRAFRSGSLKRGADLNGYKSKAAEETWEELLRVTEEPRESKVAVGGVPRTARVIPDLGKLGRKAAPFPAQSGRRLAPRLWMSDTFSANASNEAATITDASKQEPQRPAGIGPATSHMVEFEAPKVEDQACRPENKEGSLGAGSVAALGHNQGSGQRSWQHQEAGHRLPVIDVEGELQALGDSRRVEGEQQTGRDSQRSPEGLVSPPAAHSRDCLREGCLHSPILGRAGWHIALQNGASGGAGLHLSPHEAAPAGLDAREREGRKDKWPSSCAHETQMTEGLGQEADGEAAVEARKQPDATMEDAKVEAGAEAVEAEHDGSPLQGEAEGVGGGTKVMSPDGGIHCSGEGQASGGLLLQVRCRGMEASEGFIDSTGRGAGEDGITGLRRDGEHGLCQYGEYGLCVGDEGVVGEDPQDEGREATEPEREGTGRMANISQVGLRARQGQQDSERASSDDVSGHHEEESEAPACHMEGQSAAADAERKPSPRDVEQKADPRDVVMRPGSKDEEGDTEGGDESRDLGAMEAEAKAMAGSRGVEGVGGEQEEEARIGEQVEQQDVDVGMASARAAEEPAAGRRGAVGPHTMADDEVAVGGHELQRAGSIPGQGRQPTSSNGGHDDSSGGQELQHTGFSGGHDEKVRLDNERGVQGAWPGSASTTDGGSGGEWEEDKEKDGESELDEEGEGAETGVDDKWGGVEGVDYEEAEVDGEQIALDYEESGDEEDGARRGEEAVGEVKLQGEPALGQGEGEHADSEGLVEDDREDQLPYGDEIKAAEQGGRGVEDDDGEQNEGRGPAEGCGEDETGCAQGLQAEVKVAVQNGGNCGDERVEREEGFDEGTLQGTEGVGGEPVRKPFAGAWKGGSREAADQRRMKKGLTGWDKLPAGLEGHPKEAARLVQLARERREKGMWRAPLPGMVPGRGAGAVTAGAGDLRPVDPRRDRRGASAIALRGRGHSRPPPFGRTMGLAELWPEGGGGRGRGRGRGEWSRGARWPSPPPGMGSRLNPGGAAGPRLQGSGLRMSQEGMVGKPGLPHDAGRHGPGMRRGGRGGPVMGMVPPAMDAGLGIGPGMVGPALVRGSMGVGVGLGLGMGVRPRVMPAFVGELSQGFGRGRPDFRDFVRPPPMPAWRGGARPGLSPPRRGGPGLPMTDGARRGSPYKERRRWPSRSPPARDRSRSPVRGFGVRGSLRAAGSPQAGRLGVEAVSSGRTPPRLPLPPPPPRSQRSPPLAVQRRLAEPLAVQQRLGEGSGARDEERLERRSTAVTSSGAFKPEPRSRVEVLERPASGRAREGRSGDDRGQGEERLRSSGYHHHHRHSSSHGHTMSRERGGDSREGRTEGSKARREGDRKREGERKGDAASGPSSEGLNGRAHGKEDSGRNDGKGKDGGSNSRRHKGESGKETRHHRH